MYRKTADWTWSEVPEEPGGGDPKAAAGGKGCEGSCTGFGENLDFLAAGEAIFVSSTLTHLFKQFSKDFGAFTDFSNFSAAFGTGRQQTQTWALQADFQKYLIFV